MLVYHQRVSEFIESFGSKLEPSDFAFLRELVDNNENEVALVNLAWLAHSGKFTMPSPDRERLLELGSGLIDPNDLPPGFMGESRTRVPD